MGDSYLLPPVEAVVIGGTRLSGGSGGYAGTISSRLYSASSCWAWFFCSPAGVNEPDEHKVSIADFSDHRSYK